MPGRYPALIAGALVALMRPALAQTPAPAPTSPEMQQVLQRLDRVEEQNREQMVELRALRQQLAAQGLAPGGASGAAPSIAGSQPASPAAPAPVAGSGEAAAQAPLADRMDVEEQRTAQLDQEKISTDHKLPLTFTGMLLANTFWTGAGAGGAANPTLAAAAPGPVNAGGTFRQSVLGVKFDGPEIFGGGKVTGSAYVDFFGGSGATLNQLVRLRVASINATWKDTTVTFALDKPIVAPREPDSLAQVGVSPLTSAGNLWLWQPQVRVEQRFHLGDNAGLRAQAGIYQTSESGTGEASEYGSYLAKSRPGYEGRFEFWAGGDTGRRLEIAPSFHVSSTHLLEQSTPSQIFSIDWLLRPFSRLDFTGQFFHGEDVGVVGGLLQGVSVVAVQNGVLIKSVGATGGWGQIKIRILPRLTMNLYGGQEDDRNHDLWIGSIAKNQTYAGNVMYRFGSNILAAFEASQTRTTYLNSGTRLFPHYDLALAYLF